ncbi:MAG TPA: VWA domain-containing protein [Burkholderiaceae bacterium]
MNEADNKGAAAQALEPMWRAAWEPALAAWSRHTRLRQPVLCLDHAAAAREGLTESFAMIRLTDQTVVIDLARVAELGLGGFAVEILAHEIGHHVHTPASLTDSARLLARMRPALPTVEAEAAMVANLYEDLLINDRLERQAGLRMGEVFAALRYDGASRLTRLYFRVYEHLWRLPAGSIVAPMDDAALEGDALLCARLVRSYARDWLGGASRFAALCLTYLIEDKKALEKLRVWHDTRDAGRGGWPAGLIEIDPAEREPIIHPADDPALNDLAQETATRPARTAAPQDVAGNQSGLGQKREPFEFGELLRAAGVDLSDHDIAIRYYQERALPHLVRFPERRQPRASEPLPEGLSVWEPGEPLERIDWLQSVLANPVVVPGFTTVQRLWGSTDGERDEARPLDLDLYVDCSGSMPNPQIQTSFTTLAGAILVLSALRAGAHVKVTLWSGKNQFYATPGFVRDKQAAMAILTDYFGGGTAFPIHLLRETYARPPQRKTHIVILSDDGVTTMYNRDERDNDGYDIATRALKAAGGGGTMVLNLMQEIDGAKPRHPYLNQIMTQLRRARDQQGWDVHRVRDWSDMVAFARAFSRRHYVMEDQVDRKEESHAVWP